MRVALFTDTFSPQVNGVTNTLDRQVDYFMRKKIDFLVFAPEQEPGNTDSHHICRVMSLPFPLYPECRISLSRYATIEKQLLKFRPDIIHLVTPFAMGILGHRYGQQHHVPMVASYTTNFDQYLDYYGVSFLKNLFWYYTVWFHSFCERNYCPSSSTKQVLEQRGIRNIEIWSRGIDTQKFSPELKTPEILAQYNIPTSKVILLYVGRVAPEKDLDILLEAYRTLPGEVLEKVHLVIAGDGPLKEKLNSSQYPGVTWTGFVRGRELAELYASSDIFVFPSGTETFGNVVLEAMASGLPVIGVNAGGVTDIISHMKNGWICEPRSVESFREAMISLIQNDYLRQQMASFARMNALKRSWENLFDVLVDSYRDAVHQSAALQNAHTL